VFAVGVHEKENEMYGTFLFAKWSVVCMLIGLDTVGLMEDQTIV
jgi:hypothetical protein